MGNHEHNHIHCQHTNIAYCNHCNVCYCKGCGEEWGSRSYWYYPYTTVWGNNTLTFTADDGLTGTNPEVVNICSHN